MSRFEECRELVDLRYDAYMDHPTNFTLSESTSHAHNYEANPHFDFSAEDFLHTQRFEEGYDLPDPKYDARLNIRHPSVLPSLDQQFNSQLTFSAEEEILYARRFEEGYDLPDPKYEAWLNIHHSSGLLSPDEQLKSQSTFSADEEILYARRFEEGYDLTDPKYEAWLGIHHPIAESVIINKAPITDLHVSSNVTSLHVDPATSSATVIPTCTTDCSQTVHEKTSAQSLTPVRPMIRPNPTQLKLAHSTTAQTPSTPVLDNPSSAGSASLVRDSTKRSPLAELVNLPKIDYRKRTKTGKARVLTSNECLKALQDKEEKKWLAEEEKKIKKLEREQKRKQKEEELQHKKEVRAQKVADKEAKQRMQQAKQQEKRAKQNPNKRKSDISSASRPKRNKDNIDDEIDINRCCTCFGTYVDDAGTDRQWVMCSCNRWIHEDCIDPDDVADDTCKVCPLC